MRHHTLVQLAWTTHTDSSSHTPTSASFHGPVKITRVGRDRDKALVFRGWSRLCLHAASLSAAEGPSAAATAAARAVRAETMEMEAIAAAEKAKAYGANPDTVASREQAKRDEAGASTSAAELEQLEEAMNQVLQKQRERGAKMLVRRSSVCTPFAALVPSSCLAATTLPYGR